MSASRTSQARRYMEHLWIIKWKDFSLVVIFSSIQKYKSEGSMKYSHWNAIKSIIMKQGWLLMRQRHDRIEIENQEFQPWTALSKWLDLVNTWYSCKKLKAMSSDYSLYSRPYLQLHPKFIVLITKPFQGNYQIEKMYQSNVCPEYISQILL